jgi:serine phosphatase RsbU (regulator of sigma subunit)
MLGEDKYMTIMALAAHRDGAFVFSGQHQDIMIYRVVTGEVERITTNGMWIGIQDDIKGILRNDSVTLGIGDVMVLYTDGVTEAWRKNTVHGQRRVAIDMYGVEGLMAAIKENGHKSAEDIKNSIIKSLEKEFESNDDVTIVTIKRLR